MRLPYYTKYTMTAESEENLIRQLTNVLDIMQEERDFADTHSQRNSYRNIARLRLERIIEALRLSDHPGIAKPDGDGISF